MRDTRNAPFCWQGVAALATLRDRFVGKERTTALAIYCTMTELANEHRADTFRATRKEIASRAGVTSRTMDRYAEAFVEIGVLRIEREKSGELNLPNAWTLVGVAQPEALVAQPNALGGGAANSTPSQEEQRRQEETSPNGEAKTPSATGLVWAHYLEVMGKPEKRLPEEEARIIREALKHFSLEDCCRAIDGCFASDFHMKRGQHAHREGSVYNHVRQILKGKPGKKTMTEVITDFIETAEKAGAGGGLPAAGRAKVSRAKQAILRAWEYPLSEVARDEASKAETWLALGGTRVLRGPDGRPTFHDEEPT